MKLCMDYFSAKAQLEASLVSGLCSFSDFSVDRIYTNCSACVIYNHTLNPIVPGQEVESNFVFEITYSPLGVEAEDIKKTFILLSPIADVELIDGATKSLWNNDAPDTIALCKEDKCLYFVVLNSARISFIKFCEFSDTEMEQLSGLVYSEPYKISIRKPALIAYFNGTEGTNHLRANLEVVLNCGIPISKTFNL